MAFETPREVVASASRTADGDSGSLELRGGGRTLTLLVDVTAVAGTSPTLDLTVEWSPDGGTTWFPAETADAFAQITAVGKVAKQFDMKAPDYRVVWALGGTSPDFTFAVDEYVT